VGEDVRCSLETDLAQPKKFEVGEIDAFKRILIYGPAFDCFEVAVAICVVEDNTKAMLDSFDLKVRALIL
jgi:hypothetical protein